MNGYGRMIGGLGLAMLGVSLAAAGELPVGYLTPDQFSANVGDAVLLRVKQGEAKRAEPAPWPANDLAWLFQRAAGTQRNRHNVPASSTDPRAAAIQVEHGGVTVVGYDSRTRVIETTGADLQAFLERNVATADRDPAVQRLAGQQKVRVRRLESGMTLIRAPEPDGQRGPSLVAMSKTGQRTEIRLYVDPTVMPVGTDLPVKTYVDGGSINGVKVQATCLASGETFSTASSRGAMANLRINHPGKWLIEFHHAQPCAAGSDADWEVRSATVTFEVPAEGGAEK